MNNARNGKPTEATKLGFSLPGIPRWQAVGVEKVASKIFVKKFTDETFPDELELA